MRRRIRRIRARAQGRIRELMAKVRSTKAERDAKVAAIRATFDARALSPEGAEFIASWEGFRSTPYNDAAGHATIGYGHLLHYGPVTEADRDKWGSISRRRALRLLSQDAQTAAQAVLEGINVPLNRNRFDALVSFTFNVGAGAFMGSSLRKTVNATAHRKVREELMRWVYAGGVVVQGLANRRKAEADLYERTPRV